jgi:hypothetical protein
MKGHLDALQWARTNGCPWNEETCAQAASNGHLDVLQWARANDCPWDEQTCNLAAAYGHDDVYDWAHANGCPCIYCEHDETSSRDSDNLSIDSALSLSV